MKESMLSFINQSEETSGLLLINPVTGFGKTHEAIETICQYMNQPSAGPERPIHYLTPRLNNIQEVYDGLRAKIADENVFNNRVINIQSNYSYLESAFRKLNDPSDTSFTEDEIPIEIRTSGAYIKLIRAIPHRKK